MKTKPPIFKFPRPRISLRDIKKFTAAYQAAAGDRDRNLSTCLTEEIFPAYRRAGFLEFEQFVTVCMWKSPRAKPRFEANDPELVREISALARTTSSERLRIQLWTLLDGVQWPTASVFLHFTFPDKYPILDVRAIWSLGIEHPGVYTFSFWRDYTEVCRQLASKAGVTMRQLDQALWAFSEQQQGKL